MWYETWHFHAIYIYIRDLIGNIRDFLDLFRERGKYVFFFTEKKTIKSIQDRISYLDILS